MKETKRFSVIGGDKRMMYLAKLLVGENFYVNTYGIDFELNDEVVICDSLTEAVNGTDIIITPLPFSRDNETINCSLSQSKILIKDLFECIDKTQQVFGGYINNEISEMSSKYGIIMNDYFTREELVIQNCIPTAEGAIKIAIEELTGTVHGSKCLVMGFGRIGKILSKMLWGIGANVFVEARRADDIAWINSYSYNAINLNELEKYISDFDIIFNTIPHVILDEKLLLNMRKDCLIIDLASSPGGVDYLAAEKLNINTKLALGLPGLVSPLAAAKYIKTAIFNILNEKGVDVNA